MSELIEYIKNRNGQRIGVVIAKADQNEIQMGWSLCKKGDKFDSERALTIAHGRAINGSVIPLPQTVSPYYLRMAPRAQKYFKGCQFGFKKAA